MGRPKKQTADWFPHYVSDNSRTKFILQENWGNDGYAFWFKLLEILCSSDGHSYDCTGFMNMEYLTATVKVDKGTANDILNTLAEMGKIDKPLWEQRHIIWCQSLVDNLSTMYSKRTVSAPEKPSLGEFPNRKLIDGGVSDTENPHSTVQYNTEQNNIKTIVQNNGGTDLEEQDISVEKDSKKPTLAEKRFDEFWETYPKKVGKKAAFNSFKKIKMDEELFNHIINAVRKAKQTQQWQKNNGQFIPNPATWINQGRWDDEYEGVNENAGRDNGAETLSGFHMETE